MLFYVCLFCQLPRKICYIFPLSSKFGEFFCSLFFFIDLDAFLLDTDELRHLYPSVKIRFYHFEIHLLPLLLYLFQSLLCLISLWLYNFLLLYIFVTQLLFIPLFSVFLYLYTEGYRLYIHIYYI